ncbi:inositol phosphorylceramide synthase [Natrarchaeobius halalkaliphilus]|uniref:Inositol phosphorylceramide synthase n=1 Tax=Natrarchaeobius halalkaliphilus TaxID=1679091 RepID=A0A3N6P3D1_9EURY|nr:phosphatase PAP2 family protein [Natrarchaeobius halalkaliphilus]RQG89775.1 inositol phosphorylceramide synthase [Natrarchaeobius halalkaliphilus]
MSLVGLVLELVIVVVTMLVTATLVIVGPRRFMASLSGFRRRIEVCTLPLAALAVVLALRWSTVDPFMRLERRVLGTNITPLLFELEFGEQALLPVNPIVLLQSIQSPEVTSFFIFVYVYGYAFLLLFPFIAYFALEDSEDLRTLLLAFTANYGIGLICYALFIAYGPRNVDPTIIEGVLYDAFPQSGLLTHRVNQNTNVFPSLHTSLSMTVFFVAWLTRAKYPLWLPISGVLAISVALSTMYLGIHWFSDVVAGTILAAVSVYIGRTYTVDGILESTRQYLDRRYDRLRRTGGE